MKKKIYSKYRQTREQLADRYRHLTPKERIALSGSLDMKNHTITGDLGGYCKLAPNDSTAKAKKTK